MRHDLARAAFREVGGYDLVVLSPGPGRPSDFAMAETLDLLVQRQLPVFGVCLGLQGIVEYFGGSLGVLDVPVHGKPSLIHVLGGRLFCGLPAEFTVGRYHSLHARRSTLPTDLLVTAETEDAVVMAIEHQYLPIAAVQFHPESVATEYGYAMLQHFLHGSHAGVADLPSHADGAHVAAESRPSPDVPWLR